MFEKLVEFSLKNRAAERCQRMVDLAIVARVRVRVSPCDQIQLAQLPEQPVERSGTEKWPAANSGVHGVEDIDARTRSLRERRKDGARRRPQRKVPLDIGRARPLASVRHYIHSRR